MRIERKELLRTCVKVDNLQFLNGKCETTISYVDILIHVAILVREVVAITM